MTVSVAIALLKAARDWVVRSWRWIAAGVVMVVGFVFFAEKKRIVPTSYTPSIDPVVKKADETFVRDESRAAADAAKTVAADKAEHDLATRREISREIAEVATLPKGGEGDDAANAALTNELRSIGEDVRRP